MNGETDPILGMARRRRGGIHVSVHVDGAIKGSLHPFHIFGCRPTILWTPRTALTACMRRFGRGQLPKPAIDLGVPDRYVM